MEENKKGTNTLYAVLGVATLVVAIIGATFAYFSASQTNNDITGSTAEAGGLVITAEQITENTNTNIIPLNLIPNQKANDDGGYVDADDQFDDAMTNKCVDDLGNNICTIYKVVVSNQSKTSTVQVRGKLQLTSNTTNMYWTLINAETETQEIGEEEPKTTVERLTSATAIGNFTKVKQGFSGNMTYDADSQVNIGTEESSFTANAAKSLSLYGTEDAEERASSVTFYVLVWLEEIGDEQQDADASAEGAQKTYTGNITFDAVDAQGNKSGVTATFLS